MKTSPSHLPGAQTTRGDASIHLYRQVPHLQETETFPLALLKFSVSWLTQGSHKEHQRVSLQLCPITLKDQFLSPSRVRVLSRILLFAQVVAAKTSCSSCVSLSPRALALRGLWLSSRLEFFLLCYRLSQDSL